MSLWSFLKRYGRRKAGTYGRVNHKRDKRAAGKAVRRFKTHQQQEIDHENE